MLFLLYMLLADAAALGLALRAAGAGLKVYIGQFLKDEGYSELNSINRFKSFNHNRAIWRKFTEKKGYWLF